MTAAAVAAPGVPLVDRLRPAWTTLGPAICIIVAQQVLFPTRGDPGVIIQGVTLGMLTALVALGMALIYRANRILNFAQGDLGLVPVSLAVNLIAFSGLNYFLAATIGLAAAVVVGGVVELAIIRRFFRAPRLILTVATIGLAQLLAFASLALPQLWGEDPLTARTDIPITWRWEVAPYIFSADYLAAWIVAPLVMVGVALFLRYTDVGIAIRASAERADRASLLGIPVGRLHTVVWSVACTLSFIALFLRAGISGLPFGPTLGFTVLLSALATLMVGRLTNLAAITTSAVALGMLEAAVSWNDALVLGPFHLDLGSDYVIAPVLAVVILITLVVQRRGFTRAEHDTTSTWQAAEEIRPIPRELRGLTEVRAVTWSVLGLFLAAAVALPTLLGPGDTRKAAAVFIFAIIIVSIVVLTGWAGQVSLGQLGFAAIGGAVGARITIDWGLDLTLVVLLAGLVGAVVAVGVGLPALRLQGLYLAVTTLAFALAVTRYFLNPQFFAWVPVEPFDPPKLLGRWDYTSPDGLYFLGLVSFLVSVVLMLGVRQSRTGRVLVAIRENERSAQSFGVSVVRAKLTAFALSGFLAASAGAILALYNGQFSLGLFPEEENLVAFTAAVVGGLGSFTGALLGALFLYGGKWFLQDEYRLLASAIGVLLVLLLLPGGLAGVVFRIRDLWLRWVAERRGIVVPSLLADTRQAEAAAEEAFEARAEAMAEEDPGEPAPAPGSTESATPDPGVAATPPAVSVGGGAGA